MQLFSYKLSIKKSKASNYFSLRNFLHFLCSRKQSYSPLRCDVSIIYGKTVTKINYHRSGPRIEVVSRERQLLFFTSPPAPLRRRGEKYKTIIFLEMLAFHFENFVRASPASSRAIRSKSVNAQIKHTSGFPLLSLTQKRNKNQDPRFNLGLHSLAS